jgi:hypothetical protein
MNPVLRRLRGALAIGVTWALLWGAIALILFVGFMLFEPEDVGPGEGLTVVVPVLAAVGFLSGLGFSLVLAVTERSKAVHELALPRVALWGLLGGVAIPLLMGADGGMGWITGPMGAIFATTSVALARRESLAAPAAPRLSEAEVP